MSAGDWPDEVHAALKRARITLVGYVPDAGHKRLIELCHADAAMRPVVLTTEEEGIGLAAGAWLGGARSVLLMQSSGVGNCINALGLMRECGIPLLLLATMRGEDGEFNSWQVPMGQATRPVLESMGVSVRRVVTEHEIAPSVSAAAGLAFERGTAVAVLIAQQVIGFKSFQEQAAQ